MAAEALPLPPVLIPESESDEWWPNSQYGHTHVLREYSGWVGPIHALVPHGTNFDQVIHESEVLGPPVVLSWPQRRDEAFAAWGKHVIPSCAPYLYVLALRGELSRRERVGSLFFPAHTTHEAVDDTDWDELAASCESLPQPVRVCMHFIDIQKGRAAHFEGREVVTCGELFEPLFLARFEWLVAGAEVVASNSPGSCLFYAAVSGVPNVWMHGREPIQNSKPEWLPTHETVTRKAEIAALFRPHEPVTDELREMARLELGAERMRTPVGLYDDLAVAKAMSEPPPRITKPGPLVVAPSQTAGGRSRKKKRKKGKR